ncbi:NmrA family NAD(P)-binding protein [Mycobacterium manitobense]|uniref:NmrA family NAD(P)-binding protein n=1 Tax=[Mycobacterium] manitobense TaxID=190147 RepID=A0A9X3BLT0_9MYCO|nr:NmrA family NAD(P)-binding protein [[Mycobacterium] manitobense]MCV7169230.1 NmrA family NAD(P)-binding protein [[Mycobacterium] manitobense]
MLVITGPTGNVGAELVDILGRQTNPLPRRIASRHTDTRPGIGDAAEVERTRLDFFDRTTWDGALAGVTQLFLLFPLPGNRAAREGIVPFLRAAQGAGCRHVVYVSVFGADRARFIPHYTVEAALRESAMTWTVLRCSFFMQNLHRHISTHGVDITERGELFIPAGAGRTTFLDARDAAAVAALALLDPDSHRNTVHHLTGPEALSMEQVAAALTEELGYPVTYTNPGLIKFARRLRSRGVGWDSIGFMSAVYTLTRLGQNQPITDDVRRLLDRSPRDLATFLRDNAWRWRERSWT